jgi:hypothetical protein
MKEIQLTKGKVALVDDDDWIRCLQQGRWHCLKPHGNESKTSYAANNNNKGCVLLHRFILRLIDNSKQVDHIDGNGLNNQKNNLRIVDKFQQARNVRKISTKTYAKYKGVTYNSKPTLTKHWRAYIKIHGKQVSLGYHLTEDAAAREYNLKAKELFGNYASFNIIEKETNLWTKLHGLLY